ncbi:oxidoreductase [Xylariomycetidae sp. FL2044]|nr:oxidoreductase [Xylariomycetidae sp. FL2044]
MASENVFQYLPPFPDDIPTAPLPTISLADLRSTGNEAAARSLLAAGQTLDFFLVDLRGDDLGERLMGEIDTLFGLSKDLFDLPEESKRDYLHDAPRSFLGYKSRGEVPTETKQPDHFEWFNVGQDGLMGNENLQALPPVLSDNLALLKSYLHHGQEVASIILQLLATQLGLERDAFTSLQLPTKPSGTNDEEAGSPRTSMIHHTDFGTVTLLTNVVGGLQVLAPDRSPMETEDEEEEEEEEEGAWLWVRPRPGCLIVNLGDAMVEWTGGLLRSNVHRIRYAPGAQWLADRYSLATLFRPERDASMRQLIGARGDEGKPAMTAWEWEAEQFAAIRRGYYVVKSKGGKLA